MSIANRPEVAIAILHRQGKLLMQLRDDIPGILYPGHWGLFGGHLEPGESPETAVQRELVEEIGYVLPVVMKFGCYEDSNVIRHIYQAPLLVDPSDLVLCEGWDMDLLGPEEIHHGHHYSPKANQIRPLGKPHQKILLDFLADSGGAIAQ